MTNTSTNINEGGYIDGEWHPDPPQRESELDERIGFIVFGFETAASGLGTAWHLSGALHSLELHFARSVISSRQRDALQRAILSAEATALDVLKRRVPKRLIIDGMRAAFEVVTIWGEPIAARRSIGKLTPSLSRYVLTMRMRVLRNLCHNLCLAEEIASALAKAPGQRASRAA